MLRQRPAARWPPNYSGQAAHFLGRFRMDLPVSVSA